MNDKQYFIIVREHVSNGNKKYDVLVIKRNLAPCIEEMKALKEKDEFGYISQHGIESEDLFGFTTEPKNGCYADYYIAQRVGVIPNTN